MPESFYVEPVEAVLRRFVEDFRNIVAREGRGSGTLDALRAPVEGLLLDPTWITDEFRRPIPGDTAAWAIYRSQDPDLCIFTMVVPPMSMTKVHNHLTDGWVGLVQGEQVERKFVRRDDGAREGYAELELVSEDPIGLGELTPLKHPDEDIHQVVTASAVPSVSLHVLCNDLGTVERQAFEPDAHRVQDFVSGYTNVDGVSSIGR
jgi:predicted metal-dependent enzyme (double-stranded beta helix superfamily)